MNNIAQNILLLFIFIVVLVNLWIYSVHHDSNYCAAEIDYVKHGIGQMLDHYGIDGLAE